MTDKSKDNSLKRHQRPMSELGCVHWIYTNIPEDQKVSDKTEKGVRVTVAKIPDTKCYFIRFYAPGSPGYPEGGVKVYNHSADCIQSFYIDSVALHPDKSFRRVEEET